MALSRPLAHSECTAQEAHDHTGGRAVYASGCLHAPVLAPRAPSAGAPAVALSHPQASTSCFIFPGLALGLLVSGARHLRDDALLVAAEALAARVGDADRARGALYPPFACVREVSAHVARAVAASVYDAGLASAHPRPRDLLAEVRAWQWQPGYKRYAGM